ncbi:uncharacterized protein GIQ15_06584 [Arthroderma uncinatum]|uniref:uncharacterized protein n=1 Tax=Arthroderma uncinatum TaxID=74035 RepID=UPI00144AEEA8|nr:uncharacterized protein GIQ15_06584 [Arthroderma uncinatum]KAF3479608.1 hypothetical protein GIQ15_06584 [Arthroderma uncinatum]
MTSALNFVEDSKLQFDICAGYTCHVRQRREERWKNIKEIGQGAYGKVWLQECMSNDKDRRLRAVKSIPKSARPSEAVDYTHELLAIAKFSQPKYEDFFLRSFGWYEDAKCVFITMEYLEHADLNGHLGEPLPEKEAQLITAQLLQGLEYMHTNKFTHRDLKPENIFVVSKGPRWWVKIGDFGLSKRVEESTALKTRIGTFHYMAPEMRRHSGRRVGNPGYTSAVDMWSLGVTGLLEAEPENRMTVGDALQHDWMKSSINLESELSPQGTLKGDFEVYPSSQAGFKLSIDSFHDGGSNSRISSTINHTGASKASRNWKDLELSTPLQGKSYGLCDKASESFTLIPESIGSHRDIPTKYASQGGKTQGSALSTATTFIHLAEEPNVYLGPENQLSPGAIQKSAIALFHKKRHEEAEIEYQELVRQQGTRGYYYWESIMNPGYSLYPGDGDVPGDEKRFKQALRNAYKILSRDHHCTLGSIDRPDSPLYCQAEAEKTEKCLKQAIQAYKKDQSHDRIDTLASTFCLGQFLCLQNDKNKLKDAEKYLKEAVRGYKEVKGHGHLYTLESAYRLGQSLCLQDDQNKWKEAEKYLNEAIQGYRKFLGNKKWQRRGQYGDSASTYCLGISMYLQNKWMEAEIKWADAEIQLRKLVNSHKKIRSDSEDTLMYTHCLGLCLDNQEKYKEAEAQFQEAAKGREDLLGRDHEDTKESIKWIERAKWKRRNK